MTHTRAQLVSIVLALVLTLVFLAGAVLRLAQQRGRLADEGAEHAHQARALGVRAETAEARAVRQEELLASVDRARVVAEEQRAEARHGLFLAHLEAAAQALAAGRLDAYERRAALVPPEHRGWAFDYLAQQRRQQVVTLSAHAQDVTALASASSRFAAAARDGRVRVYGAPPGGPELERELALGKEVSALAFDAAGGRLGVGTDAGEAQLHDLGEPGEPRVLTLGERVTALAFVPGSKRVLLGLFDGTTWLAQAGLTTQLATQAGPVNAIAVSRDGRLAATAADDGIVHLLSGDDFETVVALAGHTDWVRALAFDSNGERLACGAEDGSLSTWDTSTAELIATDACDDTVVATRYLPGDELGTVLADGAAPGARLPLADDDYVDLAALAPDGSWLVFSNGGPEVGFWRRDPPPSRALSLSTAAGTLAVSSDGGRIAAGCSGGSVRLLDRANGRVLHEWASDQEAAPAVGLSADGRLLCAGGVEGVRLWDADTGELLRELEVPADRVHDVGLSTAGAEGRVTAVANDGRQWTWSLATGELLHASPRPQGFLFLTRVDRTARRFAWVGDAGTVRVWDTLTGERLAGLRERTLGRVEDLDLGQDGTRLVVIANEHELATFDLEGGALLARVQHPGRSFRAVAFHPALDCFATGALDGSVVVWDTQSCAALVELVDGGAAVTDVVFSADGTQLFVSTADGSLRSFEARP